jgi:hypothetical protein
VQRGKWKQRKKGTEVGFSDGAVEEAEDGRECQVVGTPWLYKITQRTHFTSISASSGEFHSQHDLSTADGGIGIR